MRSLSIAGSRAATALLGVTALTGLSASPALAHDGDHDKIAHSQALYDGASSLPVLTSDNVHHLANVPDTSGISGVFSPSAPYFYVSSVKSISVYDVSDPRNPQLTGILDNLVFENEAMNYGERTNSDGSITRFVLVGVDLTQASTSDIQHNNPQGKNEVLVIDVTDPANPFIRSRTPALTSTHTVACVDVRNCTTAYTAGSKGISGTGEFSVLSLTNLNRPHEVDAGKRIDGLQAFRSPAAGPGGPLVAGHKWNFDAAGYGFHTGGAGTAVFDVSRPRHPQLVTTTGTQGVQPGWNDFIHHNSWHPHAKAFRPHAAASVANGNVLLITEEDYENTDCATAGSFQTWKIKTLDGAASAVVHLDKINPVTEGGGGYSPPTNAFCSAHWFDYHPSGIVALATYAGGLRLIDVRDPRDLKQYGYATAGASEVWDAYWAPKRNAAGEAVGSTNIVYTVDLVRGLDVYAVDLPGDAGAQGAVALGGQSYDAGIDGPAALVLLGALGLGVVLRRRAAGGAAAA